MKSRGKKSYGVLLGGGGHAHVLIECLLLNKTLARLEVLENDASLWGKTIMGVPIIGGEELLPELCRDGLTGFVVGVGSTGDTSRRRQLFDLGLSHHLKPVTIIHPKSYVSASAVVGEGAQILMGSLVGTGVRIGRNAIVNSGAIVEHDDVIGDHAHVSTGVRLASTVHVGEGAHVGIGATVKECIRIGSHSIVGAGSVVIEDVPPGATVVGVPAKILVRKKTPRGVP